MIRTRSTYYSDYLHLDRLLSCQTPKSAAAGAPAHDEMLFIVVHQVYELWFKQVLHELDRVQTIFAGRAVDDRDIAVAAHGLSRIVVALRLGVQQLDLLETMTPLDFLDFRDLLYPASGFQSVQFREIEVRLGLKREARVGFEDAPFDGRLNEADRGRVAAAEGRPALVDQVDSWLARTPFVETAGWRFHESYRAAVARMIEADIAIVRDNPALDGEDKAAQVGALGGALERFDALFDADPERRCAPAPGWRMSRAAIQAALFINLYRDEPALQAPFRLLSLLMDIDETLTAWRFRHALMVERMIGRRIGTGGSAGAGYLRRTSEEHRIAADLFALSTFLIPRAALPALPEDLRARMGLAYGAPQTQEGSRVV